MRLYLAVAVLMLAFVAYTEAQDDTFTEQMKNAGQDLADRFRAAVEEIRTNDFIVRSQNWLREQFIVLSEGAKKLGQ